MTDSKLFFDTPPVIYLIEENPHFLETVSVFLAEALRNQALLITSVVTLAEASVKPKKFDGDLVILKIERTLKNLFEVHPITWEMAEISATLRAKYASLRGMDSLQIACAIATGCDAFITNDRRLKIVKEIRIQQIKDL
jgi:predicted nucleic acid-binding protein